MTCAAPKPGRGGRASAWMRPQGGVPDRVRMVTLAEDLLPCWRIWRSGLGAWYDLDLSQAAMELGYVRTVGADTAQGLRGCQTGRLIPTLKRSLAWAV